MKKLVFVPAVSFLLFLLFSIAVVQGGTGVLTETRKSALVGTLIPTQLNSGAFRFFTNVTGPYYNEAGTSDALSILNILNQLDNVDLDRAMDYLASTQNNVSGGFGAFYGGDGVFLSYDMECTRTVVHILRILNALERINMGAVAGFVLARSNQSAGSFREFLTEAYGRRFAMASFGLGFHSWNDEMAYAIPNVISTYLAVSTLADLGMLNLINVTKTAEWLMSCQASNAAFKPYPAAGPTSLPGYSSLVTNPFDVDHSGTGVPYTYAAVEALRCIGKLDSLSQNDKESIKEYLLSCQNGGGNFYIHADSDDWHNRYTYYAVITLRDIGMLDESQEALIDVVTHISDDIYFQELQLDDAFPLPVPRSYLSYKYGMFQEWSTDPLEDTFYAVMILNTTGNLGKLDQFTPRAQRTALYLLLYSAFAAAVATVTAFTFIRFQSRRKHITTQPSTSQGLSQLG